MKILITGANGKLGTAVHQYFANQKGYRLTGTDLNRPADFPGTFRVADLRQREAAYALVEGQDAILHLGNIPNAMLGDPQTVCQTNVGINQNVFQAALECGVPKVIFASSIQAISFGTGRSGQQQAQCIIPYLPADEGIPQKPGNAYGLSKCLSETMLAYYVSLGLPQGVALRYPFLATRERFPDKTKPRLEGPTLGNRNELGAYLSLPDATALLERCLQADLPGYRVYFPSSYDNRWGVSGKTLWETHYAEIPLQKPLDEWGTGLVDNTTITRDTGWEPIE